MDQISRGDAHRLPTPVARLEPAPAGAVRRTTTVEARADGEWTHGQVVTARGRDLAVDAETASLHVLDAAVLNCRIDGSGLLQTAPDVVGGIPEGLVGAPARRGLRRRLAQQYPDPVRHAGLEVVLLDELPGLQIISGYAQLHDFFVSKEPLPPGQPMVNTCAGFAAGGLVATSDGPLPDMISGRPTAPAGTFPEDVRVWHEEPPATRGGIQRRRMVQVVPAEGGRVAVLAWFRDTFTAPDGAQTIVHEYAVDSTVAPGPGGLVVQDLHARPRVLPLPDCQDAVGHVVRLTDKPLADIDAAVRRELAGTAGCTHLNDLLRALRAVPLLIERLPTGPIPTTTKESTP